MPALHAQKIVGEMVYAYNNDGAKTTNLTLVIVTELFSSIQSRKDYVPFRIHETYPFLRYGSI